MDHLIKKYSDKNQELNQTFEDDWLMIVLTFNIFLDTFKIKKLEKKPLQTIKYEAKEEGW